MVKSIGYGNESDVIKISAPLKNEIPEEVGGVYYEYECAIISPLFEIKEVELCDEELRSLAIKGETFKFWDNPEEDIYSLSDGNPI